ncbi:MAG: sigma 54-interacting transcriptional regulator [Candidatus Neomarinimicrobiota bacterium]
MFDERFFDTYLVELVHNDYGYQTAEVFLEEEGQGLVRQAILFRIDRNILTSFYEDRGDVTDVEDSVRKELAGLENTCDEVAADVWRFKPLVYTKNRIINTYPPNVKSLSGSSANHIELTTVQDFDRVSPMEYSFPHRSAYESQYEKYLFKSQLKSLIAIPIFVRGIRGILRVMNKIDWRTVPYEFITEFPTQMPGYDLDRIRDIAARLSRDLTYNDNAVFDIKVPQINLSEQEGSTFENLSKDWWGASNISRTICMQAAKACHSNKPLLILGESGTGKTTLGKLIARHSMWHRDVRGLQISNHKWGKDNSGREVIVDDRYPKGGNGIEYETEVDIVNTASITPTLFESEIFGIASKSATDVSGKFGYLLIDRKELSAKHRTNNVYWTKSVLLDEIAEIPKSVQAKLLNAIDRNKVRPVGQNNDVDISCTRLIAATNRDIDDEEIFRSDLKWRFPHVIYIPPLRERKSDIAKTIERYVDGFNGERGANVKVEEEYIQALRMYDLPGNARELVNILSECIQWYWDAGKPFSLTFETLPIRVREVYESEIYAKVPELEEREDGGQFPEGTVIHYVEYDPYKDLPMAELEFVMSVIALMKNNWVVSKAQEKLGWKHPKLARRLKDEKFLAMLEEPRVRRVLEKKGFSLERIQNRLAAANSPIT